jgi:DMSO/TMAO reductase YedYZ molybdopterin-dependent catalytic subunit
MQPTRRTFLLAASALTLSGCKVLDAATRPGPTRAIFESVSPLTYRTQRLIGGGHTLAREYSRADIRQSQHPNGSTNPDDPAYVAMAATGFDDYTLSVTGLVARPQTLTLAALKAMPQRTQITRHDCVEGWSCIAEWTGVPLAAVLARAEPRHAARYAVFHCFDTIERSLSGAITYYESIDLIDANHAQSILAHTMNGAPLPIANGAPLRLRVERQLGYKMAKYIHTIELTDSLASLGFGRGSYWADRGYEWYAGI